MYKLPSLKHKLEEMWRTEPEYEPEQFMTTEEAQMQANEMRQPHTTKQSQHFTANFEDEWVEHGDQWMHSPPKQW